MVDAGSEDIAYAFQITSKRIADIESLNGVMEELSGRGTYKHIKRTTYLELQMPTELRYRNSPMSCTPENDMHSGFLASPKLGNMPRRRMQRQ